MNLYTIGFTQKTAQGFFESLSRSGVRRVIDVRLNNVSQLAGFAKKTDLIYFLQTICGIKYVHEPLLAPTQEMLDDYKKKKGKLERLRAALPRFDGVQRDTTLVARAIYRQLPLVQRRQAASLPPKISRGVPRRALGQSHGKAYRVTPTQSYKDRSSWTSF